MIARFVVCFQYEDEAKGFGEALRQRLSKFGLRIAEEKSRIIEFGRYAWQRAQRQGKRVATFDFLGFTHYCDKTRRGKFKLGRRTARKKLTQKLKEMNRWLKAVRNTAKLEEWWPILRLKLVGHYRYCQKRSYNWRQFSRFLQYNPLPLPRIYRPYPVLVKGMYS